MSLELEALETSFDLVAPHGDQLLDEYYDRFFAAAPETRPLFPEDMKKQKAKVLAMLGLLRKSLRNLDAAVPTLRALGARHATYGATADHFPISGSSLIGAMAAVAGDGWKPEYEQAWTAAFEVVAATMLEGAAAAEAELEAAA